MYQTSLTPVQPLQGYWVTNIHIQTFTFSLTVLGIYIKVVSRPLLSQWIIASLANWIHCPNSETGHSMMGSRCQRWLECQPCQKREVSETDASYWLNVNLLLLSDETLTYSARWLHSDDSWSVGCRWLRCTDKCPCRLAGDSSARVSSRQNCPQLHINTDYSRQIMVFLCIKILLFKPRLIFCLFVWVLLVVYLNKYDDKQDRLSSINLLPATYVLSKKGWNRYCIIKYHYLNGISSILLKSNKSVLKTDLVLKCEKRTIPWTIFDWRVNPPWVWIRIERALSDVHNNKHTFVYLMWFTRQSNGKTLSIFLSGITRYLSQVIEKGVWENLMRWKKCAVQDNSINNI